MFVAYYEMPYSVISDDVRTSLKEKCQLIKDLIKNGSSEYYIIFRSLCHNKEYSEAGFLLRPNQTELECQPNRIKYCCFFLLFLVFICINSK